MLQSLERRLIATTRHLTLKLKNGFHFISGTAQRFLPSFISKKITDAAKYSEELHRTFFDVRYYTTVFGYNMLNYITPNHHLIYVGRQYMELTFF